MKVFIFLKSIIVIFALNFLMLFSNNSTDFFAKKGDIWNAIQQTPEATNHVVFVNGFVGTTMVEDYLYQIAKGKFSVDVIRSYSSAGKISKEDEIIQKYNKSFAAGIVDKQAQIINKPNKLSHMKSYFWFNKNKKLIRTLTGSSNFSKNALIQAWSYKEVLYDVSDYIGVGRDLFCGAIKVTNQTTMRSLKDIYASNCDKFDINNKDTFMSKDLIKERKQFDAIVKAHKTHNEMKTAKGLLVLTGDGDSNIIEDYLRKTAEDKIDLDVFVGNTEVGFQPEIEKQWKDNKTYEERFKIIREYKLNNKTNDYGLLKFKTPKTHTKIYVWYNQNYEILGLWSGSANFSKNGVNNDEPFREVLLEIKLNRDWKHDLVCNIVKTFQSTPSNRIKNFCAL